MLSDTRVYEPQIRARLGTTAHWRWGGGRQHVAPGRGTPSTLNAKPYTLPQVQRSPGAAAVLESLEKAVLLSPFLLLYYSQA